MKDIIIRICNGYRYGIGSASPTIKAIDPNTSEEYRIDPKEIEEIIKNTILKGRFKIEKESRQKYKRIKLTN